MRFRGTHAAVPFGRVTIAAQVLTALVVAYFLLHSTGVRLPFLSSSYTVTAYVADADGLNAGDRPDVLVAGVQEGSVQSVTYEPARRETLIRLSLDDSVRGRLFADASLRIEPRSALNDLVVDVVPGSPSAGPLRGGVIERAAPAPVGYDELLGDLNADDRTYAQLLIGTLDQLLRNNPGPLRDALDRLPTMTSAATVVARELARRRSELTELVGQLNQIVTVTGRRGTQLTQALAAARQTLAVTAAHQHQIEQSITALPGTLSAAGAAFGSVTRLAQPLDPALTALRPVARSLPAALTSLRGLLPTLRSTAGDVSALVSQGTAPLRALHRTLSVLGPTARVLAPVPPVLKSAVDTISENQQAVGNIIRFWPGTFSSQDGLAVVTRAQFLTILPIEPAALGLSSISQAADAGIERAMAPLRAKDPSLFDVPASLRGQPAPLLAVAALIAQRCLGGEDVACTMLSMLYEHPPAVLS